MLSQEKFNENFRNLINSETSSFLLAVSGGVDSMVLLWLFANLKSQILDSFVVAHINYKLRGKDSDLDQKLVEDFCKENNIVCYVYELSVWDGKPKQGSVQIWARLLRYDFFRKVQERESLKYLVTAHHLNDQLETFFINLSRGSGLAGLSGIPEGDNQILRPLLPFSKTEIYTFAKEHNIPFREDISNQKNDYLRNQFRNKIIPELMEIAPNFLVNFGKSLKILNESKSFISTQIDEKLATITLRKSIEEWVLDREQLIQVTTFVRFEILRRFGFDNEVEIAKIFEAETGKVFHSKDFSLLIHRGEMILKPINSPKIIPETIVLEIENNKLDISQWVPEVFSNRHSTWFLDKAKVKLPLYLRRKQGGDTFQPIGMKGKKKVSKFLKDEKLSQWERDKVWVLCDSDDQILGIVPMRQDGRCSSHNTIEPKNVLKICF